MKKVYFACSIRGGRDDAQTYAQLIALIKQHAEVLSEVFADDRLTPLGSPGSSAAIYKQDLGWVKAADALIAEVTNPSLGVGYEIAMAEGWDKPILALYRPQAGRRLSAIIDGSPQITVVEYQNLKKLDSFISMFLGQLS